MPTLLLEHLAPQNIIELHNRIKVDAPTSDIVEIDEVVVGGLGLIIKDGDLLLMNKIFPNYLDPIIRQGGGLHAFPIWAGALLNDSPKIINLEHPVIFPFHPNWVYGHYLLEILPKIILLDGLLPKNIPILIPSGGPRWGELLATDIVRNRDVIKYDYKSEIVFTRKIYTLSNVFLGDVLCNDAVTAYDSLVQYYSLSQYVRGNIDAGKSLLYISRSKALVEWHRIENEEEVEELMRNMGFNIIYPEKMCFRDQVLIFSRANMVVGEYSSALHNCVFCPPGTVIVSINCINNYQSAIAIAKKHHIAYVPTVKGYIDYSMQKHGFNSYRVDATLLASVVQQCLTELRGHASLSSS